MENNGRFGIILIILIFPPLIIFAGVATLLSTADAVTVVTQWLTYEIAWYHLLAAVPTFLFYLLEIYVVFYIVPDRLGGVK